MVFTSARAATLSGLKLELNAEMGAPVLAASGHGGLPAISAAHDPDGAPPHIMNRVTKGKRTLWYCLKVIQQPERARACGSGPKCE